MKYFLFCLLFTHMIVISFSQSGKSAVNLAPAGLKNIVLNEKSLSTSKLLAKTKRLKKEELALFSLSKIDEVYSPGYEYKLIDTLHQSKRT